MTYSLNTLNNTQSSDEPSATERFIQEVALVLGGLALVFWVLSLLSYTSNDAAWSTTGLGTVTQNWVGRIGANVADLSYYFFGFSIWWCIVALASAWLGWLASWMRHEKMSQTFLNEHPKFYKSNRARFDL
jgi:S-DNA-T family DNA segregation ATPase FtsK/SpoIIIE